MLLFLFFSSHFNDWNRDAALCRFKTREHWNRTKLISLSKRELKQHRIWYCCVSKLTPWRPLYLVWTVHFSHMYRLHMRLFHLFYSRCNLSYDLIYLYCDITFLIFTGQYNRYFDYYYRRRCLYINHLI